MFRVKSTHGAACLMGKARGAGGAPLLPGSRQGVGSIKKLKIVRLWTSVWANDFGHCWGNSPMAPVRASRWPAKIGRIPRQPIDSSTTSA